MMDVCNSPQDYKGRCDRCKEALGNEIGTIMGPDREDESEKYLYELCIKCVMEYRNLMHEQTVEFLRLKE